MDSLSSELFKKCVNVVMRDMVSEYGGDGLTVALDDLTGNYRYEKI